MKKKPLCANCKRRPRAKHRTVCLPCKNKIRRQADPVRTSYENLKFNSTRRGKPFTITLAYFRRFACRTDYIPGDGRRADSWTVDRIKEELGYIPGNIQPLKNAANVRKYLQYDWQNPAGAKVVKSGAGSTGENLPF